MKVWRMFGSEHSANLVMIGRFKEVSDAAKAKEVIDAIIAQVQADEGAGRMKIGGAVDRYTDGMLALLQQVEVHTIGPAEIEQFAYDVTVKVEGTDVVLTSDEIDVSAFLKALLDQRARVEVYSAHDYPETKYGRGK
jgi:hypothetical protein